MVHLSHLLVADASSDASADTYLCVALQEIAKRKLPDTNATQLDSAVRMVEGTARSIGLVVVD
jgi:ribosomal protein L11